MNSQNSQVKKHIAIIGAICGSLALGMPAIAQTNSNPGNMNSTPGTRGTSSDTQLNRPSGSQRNTPSGTQSDSLSDAERDRLCANYVNERATDLDSTTNRQSGYSTAANRQSTSSTAVNRQSNSTTTTSSTAANRQSGSSTAANGQNTSSTAANRQSGSTNTGETSRITQSLPSARVNESPEVRDGRLRDRTSANAEEICANYMRERGTNRNSSSDRQGDTPSRNLGNTPATPQRGSGANAPGVAPQTGSGGNDPGALETDSSDGPSNPGQGDR